MDSFMLTLLAQARDAEPGLTLRGFVDALPTDPASLVTLAISAAAVGLVVWAGTRGNKAGGGR